MDTRNAKIITTVFVTKDVVTGILMHHEWEH